MLNFSKILSEFTYKPNVILGIRKDGLAGMEQIHIVMFVEDSRAALQPWEPDLEENMKFDDYMIDFNRYRYRPPTLYSPRRPLITVEANYTIPYFEEGDEKLFLVWVMRTLQALEEHELREWARYKGELIDDPHKEM